MRQAAASAAVQLSFQLARTWKSSGEQHPATALGNLPLSPKHALCRDSSKSSIGGSSSPCSAAHPCSPPQPAAQRPSRLEPPLRHPLHKTIMWAGGWLFAGLGRRAGERFAPS